MTELEQLKAQRREIDRKIKELTCPTINVDGACLRRKTYRGKPVDTWVVTVEEIGGTTYSKEIVCSDTKEEALRSLDIIIDTLIKLRDMASMVE